MLSDCPYNMLWHALGDLGADLQRDLDLSMQQAGQMLEHFLTNVCRLASEPQGVKRHCAVKAGGLGPWTERSTGGCGLYIIHGVSL